MAKNKFTGKEEYVEYEDGTRILLDEDDSPPLTDEDFANMKTFHGLDGLAQLIGEEAVTPLRKRGRPRKTAPKVPVKLRVDSEVEHAFRATGKGWHTLMSKALEEYARNHDML